MEGGLHRIAQLRRRVDQNILSIWLCTFSRREEELLLLPAEIRWPIVTLPGLACVAFKNIASGMSARFRRC